MVLSFYTNEPQLGRQRAGNFPAFINPFLARQALPCLHKKQVAVRATHQGDDPCSSSHPIDASKADSSQLYKCVVEVEPCNTF